MKRRHTEKGMALVITLMMLAIVTFMSVVFLSLSRRERTNVKTAEDQANARQMADAALERAKADMTSTMVNAVEKYLQGANPNFGDTNLQHQIAIANRAVQNGLFQYDLRVSRNFSNPAGFRNNEQGNPWNVSWDLAGNAIDNKGAILGTNSDNYFRQIANLQYDPRTPVVVSNGKTNDNRFYLDLDRNGMFDPSGVFDVTGPNNERYTTNNNAGNVKVATAPPYLKGLFVGDPEWIGVLERPDLPHSETNRFVGRYAYLMMPTGKSLDINYIHNLAAFTGNSTTLAYGSGTDPRYSRNQGVGPWEMNLAAFLVDLHTNAWVPPSVSASFYNYSTNAARGLAFRDAAGLLQYRLNGSRANLQTPAAFFGANRNFTWRNDNVDMAGDGPIVPYNNLAFRRTLLTDTDDGTRYWHGLEQAEKTGEFPDVQRYFKMGTATATTDQLDFYSKFTNAVTSARTNTYDRYTYYRMLAQLGADSKPALQGKIHLNYLNEPGTISTNFYSWVSSNGPATLVRPPISISWNVTSNRLALPSDPDYQVQVRTTNSTLTNFFLIAADAMLKADLVTNVYDNWLGLTRSSKLGILTNYTVGGSYFDDPGLNAVHPALGDQNPLLRRVIVNTPVRPSISVTNIQVYHVPVTNTAWVATDLTYTNNEYVPEVHRVLQVAANIYDNMTNNPGRRSIHKAGDPFFPTVWRPYYAITYTNISIVGWEPQDNAAFAITHTTNMVSMQDFFFANRPGQNAGPLLLTNVNFYGQPWVIGVKKGWPNFNEFSLETFVDVSRKLRVTKDSPTVKYDTNNVLELAKHTQQIFLIGISNKFGLEAWNSYASNLNRSIRIESEIDASFGIDRITARDLSSPNKTPTAWHPIFATPTVVRMPGSFTIPQTSGWPGRQGNKWDISQATNNVGTPGIASGKSDYRIPIYSAAAVFPAVNTPSGPLNPFAPREYADQPAPYGSLIGLPATWMSLTNVPDLRLNITNRIRYLAYDTAENKIIDYVTFDNLVTTIDMGTALQGVPTTAGTIASGAGVSAIDAPWVSDAVDSASKQDGMTKGILQQIATSMSDLPPPAVGTQTIWRSFVPTSGEGLNTETRLFREYISGVVTNDVLKTNVDRQVPYSPSRRIYYHPLYQANDPLVHYMASDILDPELGIEVQTFTPGATVPNKDLGYNNTKRWNKRHDGLHGPWFQDDGSGTSTSDDWRFPIANLDNSGTSSLYGITNFQYRFPNIGALGQIHRGTPWQTIYLKAAAAANYPPQKVPFTPNPAQNPVKPSWYNWAGSFGSHPTNDWKFVGLFTTAINETAARGLLSVNQTNIAAWSAVLSGVPVITNSLPDSQSRITQRTQFGDPNNNFRDLLIEPGSKQLNAIVKNINDYRSSQQATVMGKFYYLGQILGSPMLSLGASLLNATNLQYSPYLNLNAAQITDPSGKINWHGVTDEALEAIPARILSLLKEDEPRVTIYCFGQSLKPAPRSLVTSTDFYNLCVNYQVTGEYVTKAIVRVEGEMKNPNNPLRTVVESFEVLPPFE